MRNVITYTITVVIAIMFLVACGDETKKSYSVTYAGMAMKGPFYAGSNVTAFACDENGIQTGQAYTSYIENATGNFNLDTDVSGTVIVKAEGVYFNEIYNESSTGTIRVEAVFNATGAGTQNAFLNPISHAISACKLKKIKEGNSDEDSELACAELLFTELSLPKPDPFTLDALRNIQTPYPIAFSCGISQAARLIAQDDKTKFDTELQRIMDQTKIELASGALSTNTKTIYRNGFATLDAETCRSNLQIYLDSEEGGITIPPLSAALDSDGDGTPDSIDEDLDNDGITNELDCVNGKSHYQFISVNRDVVCAAKTDNSWKCTFHNFSSVEGVGEDTWLNTFTNVVNGRLHFCGIDTEQSLWCWGHLSIDAQNYKESPYKITEGIWKNVFAGQNRTCAIDSSDQLYCWQDNLTTAGIKVNDDTNWFNVFLGNDTFYAIKNDGTLWNWNFEEIPIQIGTDLWKFVSNTSLYAIKDDGTLWYVSDFITPIQIGTDTDWASVYGTCAVKTDNTLWCWSDSNKTPATKTYPAGWSCGQWNSISHYKEEGYGELLCGIKSDNSLWCLKDGDLIHIENLPSE